MEEINFNCPKCKGKECIHLEKRTYAITNVPVKKDENNNYYSGLSQDFDLYPDGGHIPVSDVYEKYIFVCYDCYEEFEYNCKDAFNEYDEELDIDKLKEFGFLK